MQQVPKLYPVVPVRHLQHNMEDCSAMNKTEVQIALIAATVAFVCTGNEGAAFVFGMIFFWSLLE